MKNVKNGIVAIVLGALFSASFVWLVGVGAALSVPEFFTNNYPLVALYYADIVTTIIAFAGAVVLLFLTRLVVPSFTGKQCQLILLPIIMYIAYLGWAAPFALSIILFAASPVVIVVLSLLAVPAKKQNMQY